MGDYIQETEKCEAKQLGADNYIGKYFSAPCGWGTYNRYDISHYEWHLRDLAKPQEDARNT